MISESYTVVLEFSFSLCACTIMGKLFSLSLRFTLPIHKIRGECQVILAQHLGGLPWEHRVRYAKDAEVRTACRTEVFVAGKAQSIGTPSAGQLHRAQSATSAWGVYWPCDSRSRTARVGLGSAAGSPWLASLNLKTALHCSIKPLSSCQGPSQALQDQRLMVWPRQQRGGGEDPRDASLLSIKACPCHRDQPTQEGRVLCSWYRK